MIPGPEEMLLRVTYLLHIEYSIDMHELAARLADIDDPVIGKQVFEHPKEGVWRAVA